MSVLLTATLVLISIIAIIILTSKVKLNAFISLFIVSLFLAFSTLPTGTIIGTLKEGFGSMMASIGFLIILGAIIGITLDKTKATLSIAMYILSKTGKNRSAQAIGITGFVTGLPIFCDSGFIILSGLAKSFSTKAKIAMPFIATVLAGSLYSVHCLIPPHPGALAAAGLFNVNIGNLMLLGTLYAIPGAMAAYFFSKWITKGKGYQPFKDETIDTELSIENLPSTFLSFLPIVVPLVLISIKSVIGMIRIGEERFFFKAFYLIGEPVFALAIGVILALFLIKDKKMASINSIFIESIEKAGPILIITAAGGMFGMVIKATGIGENMGKLLAQTGFGILIPFLIAAIMKTAQGSSTVAIITTASFVAPMLPMLGLDSEWGRLFAVLAMGAGSMFVSHANDSYFWVVSKFSDIDPGINLKVYSTSVFVMGIVVFSCIWVTSLFIL